MARHRTAPSDINAAEKARLALVLRKQGYTLDEIATQIGYTHRSAVSKAIRRELAHVPSADAKELRAMEELRLDDMLKVCYPKAERGDLWAVSRVIDISRRRSEVTGMDVRPEEQAANQNYVKRIILTHETSTGGSDVSSNG